MISDVRMLLDAINPLEITGTVSGPVTAVTDDSREAESGAVFFAVKGLSRDGHDFIAQVAGRAKAAVVERIVPCAEVPQIRVASVKDALFRALEVYHHVSLSELRFTGITGTNGKTTFTYLMESIYRAAGKKLGVIGTVNYRCGDKVYESSHTTPDMKRLFGVFSGFIAEGCDDVVMEVSSHALSQQRIKGIQFDVAVFSNLTPEHLDFHKTMEEYYQAKKILFAEYLKDGGVCVLNLDDFYGQRLKSELAGIRTAGFSFNRKADYGCTVIKNTAEGMEIGIFSDKCSDTFRTRLRGGFNAYNVATAYITAIESGIVPEAARQGIENLRYVPGRLEEIENGCAIDVFVDYAHTPDALENVLITVKDMARGRIILVFGCGGDRDRSKRPLMGAIAAKYADLLIITSDNPRSEDPDAIITEIRSGIGQSARMLIQPNREKAINEAIYSAKKGDTILIAGKGHEDYQIIGTEKKYFSDRKVAEDALKRRECLAVL